MNSSLKFIKYSLVGLFVLGLTWGIALTAHAQGVTVESLDTNIQVRENGMVFVTQRLVVQFMEPTSTLRWTIPTYFTSLEETNQAQASVQQVNRDGRVEQYQSSASSDGILMIMGNPNIDLEGQHTYTIEYSVSGAIRQQDDFDFLYLPISHASHNIGEATATLEFALEPDTWTSVTVRCLRGSESSTQCPVQRSGDMFEATASQLMADEWFSLFASFPPGLVIMNGDEGGFLGPYTKYAQVAGALLFVGLSLWGLLWYRRAQRRRRTLALRPTYVPPEEIKPLYVGMFVDGKMHVNDITAELLSLAKRGVIKLKRITSDNQVTQTDYEFTLWKKIEMVQDPIDNLLLEVIFGTDGERGDTRKLSSLESSTAFAKRFKKFQDLLFAQLVAQRYVRSGHRVKRWVLMIIGFGSILFSIFATTWFNLPPLIGLGVILLGIIVGYIGITFSIYTKKGRKVRNKLRGFGLFMVLSKKDRRRLSYAPNRIPDQFGKYLPYAVAFGVEDEWAGQFENMYIESPYWYEGDLPTESVASVIANEMHIFNSVVETWSMYAAKKTTISVERSEDKGGERMFMVRGFGGGSTSS